MNLAPLPVGKFPEMTHQFFFYYFLDEVGELLSKKSNRVQILQNNLDGSEGLN